MASEVEQAAITIEDCLEMYEKKNMIAVVNDGQVIDFIREKIMYICRM